jgi:DNA-binding NarL/FixJ family response regulator
VLRNYAIGKDMHEIAETLGVGEGTVKTFFTRVQRKLKAKHRGHAVHLAMREHLISYYALLTVGTILT